MAKLNDKAFPFLGGDIDLLKIGGTALVSVPQVCRQLGIDLKGQAALLREAEWAEAFQVFLPGSGEDELYISLHTLPMWLIHISVCEVADKHKHSFGEYLREAARTLDATFGPFLKDFCGSHGGCQKGE